MQKTRKIPHSRGGSRTAATSKMERFVIIVNGWKLEAVNYYDKALHLGCCSSLRSASHNLRKCNDFRIPSIRIVNHDSNTAQKMRFSI